MLVIHHPDQALHDPETVFRTGQFIPQPDRAERYRIFLEAAKQDRHEIVQAPAGPLDAITAIHDPAYVHFLSTVHGRWLQHPAYGPIVIPNVHPTHRMHRKPTALLGELGWYSNSTSCPITAGTWPAILASAHTAIHAADRLPTHPGPIYALCRPPGHHAYKDLMTGVCFLNNAAIAAHRLTRHYPRIAIVDLDVHHGNGTQSIFWTRPDVLFCSIHVDPNLAAPFYAGHADETGEGPGKYLTFNQPLPPATPDTPWLAAIDAAIARIQHFQPGALVVSLGFDAAETDPVAAFNITTQGFTQASQKLAALTLPTILVQEGGYLNPNLATYLKTFLANFSPSPPSGRGRRFAKTHPPDAARCNVRSAERFEPSRIDVVHLHQEPYVLTPPTRRAEKPKARSTIPPHQSWDEERSPQNQRHR